MVRVYNHNQAQGGGAISHDWLGVRRERQDKLQFHVLQLEGDPGTDRGHAGEPLDHVSIALEDLLGGVSQRLQYTTV